MRNEPPAEINGNGSPFTGINPTVMAVLTNTCDKKTVAKPIRARLENLSFDKNEFFIICDIKNPNIINIIDTEKKPNSSPITDKIKSDS